MLPVIKRVPWRWILIIQKEQNPLNIHWLPSSETIYVPHLVYELSNESALAITAGENKTSLTMILNDCQVSSYPHLFSTERFDYTFNRSISLSPLKNFNQRLLNYTQVFASDNDKILFAQCSNICIWIAAFQFKHFLQMMMHSTLWICWK